MIFPKFSRQIRTKVNKISINTEVNIDEVEQKTLLTICTTKLHIYYRVTLHLLDFHQNIFPKIPPPFYYPSPFYYIRESMLYQVQLITEIRNKKELIQIYHRIISFKVYVSKETLLDVCFDSDLYLYCRKHGAQDLRMIGNNALLLV